MNALYVIVSISLLLVLAGFNHAHGLSTFGIGKSNNANPQQSQPPVQAKHCTNQSNCALIKGTTCLKGYCFCGDNTHPFNGGCKTQLKGAHHMCNIDNECVDGADCILAKDKNKTIPGGPDKICLCQEGLYETQAGTCGGSSSIIVLPGVAMVIMILSRTLN